MEESSILFITNHESQEHFSNCMGSLAGHYKITIVQEKQAIVSVSHNLVKLEHQN